MALIFVIIGFILGYFLIDIVVDLIFPKEYKYKSNVPYTTLVNETMYFTGKILKQNNIKDFPKVEIRYYQYSKWCGKFLNGTIIIYIKSHTSVEQIIENTLHEMSHFISNMNKCDEYIRYNTLLKEVGYEKHPEEIKARKFARVNLNDCLKYLEKKGVIE